MLSSLPTKLILNNPLCVVVFIHCPKISQLYKFFQMKLYRNFYNHFFIKNQKRADNASERNILRGGGGVFQEKTGGNAEGRITMGEMKRFFSLMMAVILLMCAAVPAAAPAPPSIWCAWCWARACWQVSAG